MVKYFTFSINPIFIGILIAIVFFIFFLLFKRDENKRILKKYAYLLNENNKEDPYAILKYDLFSDALYWSDEFFQHWPFELISAMKVVLRYRTSCFTLASDPQYEKYWFIAKSLSPQWIGFSEKRVNPPKTVVDAYWENHQNMLADL